MLNNPVTSFYQLPGWSANKQLEYSSILLEELKSLFKKNYHNKKINYGA